MNRAEEWTHFAAGALANLKREDTAQLCLQEYRDHIHAMAYVAAAVADSLMAELESREKRGDFDAW